MTKFYLTGLVLFLLASFLHLPPNADVDSKPASPKRETLTSLPLGEQIRFARLERKMSQKELADKIGLATLNIEKIEKGQATPQKETILKIQRVLETEFPNEGY